MDGLLSQLGIDITVIYQFVVFLISYLLLSNIFFKKLLMVLKTRDDKTTKLEGNANDAFQKAEHLANEYKNKIDEAYSEAQVEFHAAKNSAVKIQKEAVTEQEKVLSKMVEKETNVFVEEIKASKEKVMSNATDLANNLVERLVR